MLVQAAWSAIKSRNWLQARYDRLVRRMGGTRNPAARKKAIVAIAHTLLKIAYAVLKSGRPYQEPGADFTPAARHHLTAGPGWKPSSSSSTPAAPSPSPSPRPPASRRTDTPRRPPYPRTATQLTPTPRAAEHPDRVYPSASGSAAGCCRAPSGTQFSCQCALGWQWM